MRNYQKFLDLNTETLKMNSGPVKPTKMVTFTALSILFY